MQSGGSLLNFNQNPLINPSFTIEYESRGEVDDWISDTMLDQVKKFVKYAVNLMDINSLWSKYKKLLVVFEETEDESFDGLCIDNDEQGVVKIFLYDLVTDVKNIMTTVAHELIHARQFCDRRLARLFKRVDGQVVGCYNWSDTGELFYGEENIASYRNLPWEIEAYSMQDEVVYSYEMGLGINK